MIQELENLQKIQTMTFEDRRLKVSTTATSVEISKPSLGQTVSGDKTCEHH